jgi:transposase
MEVRARMKVLIGVDPHKAAVAVAVVEARSDAQGGTYYRKKLAEGKSRKEALRCLKRRISDAVYKNLTADLHTPSRSAA